MEIIAIANQKGGVGKTTSAVNIAAYLSELKQKVLLIDLDPQGNASVGIGVDLNEHDKENVYTALTNDVDINKCIKKTNHKNLFVLPSNNNLAAAEIELNTLKNKHGQLKSILTKLNTNFDIVIIDCPPALGLLTINALVAANKVLIPLQCEYYSLEGISQLTRTLLSVKSKLNKNLDVLGILLTMYDKRANLTHMVEDDVRTHFKDKVLQTKIPRNVRLSEAPSHGLSIMSYDKSASGAKAYHSAALEILNRINGVY